MNRPQPAVGREQLMRLSAWARSNWQGYAVRLSAGCDQRAAMRSMLEAGLCTRRGIMCSHREAAYEDVPLPLHVQMTADEEQRRVAAALHRAMTGTAVCNA